MSNISFSFQTTLSQIIKYHHTKLTIQFKLWPEQLQFSSQPPEVSPSTRLPLQAAAAPSVWVWAVLPGSWEDWEQWGQWEHLCPWSGCSCGFVWPQPGEQTCSRTNQNQPTETVSTEASAVVPVWHLSLHLMWCVHMFLVVIFLESTLFCLNDVFLQFLQVWLLTHRDNKMINLQFLTIKNMKFFWYHTLKMSGNISCSRTLLL